MRQLELELNPPAPSAPPRASGQATNPVVPPPTAQSRTNAPRPRPEPGAVSRPTPGGYVYHHPATPVPGNRVEAQAAFDRGLAAWQEHRLPVAVRAYQQATQLDPAYYEAYFNLGLAASAAGDLPTALAAYENALAVTNSAEVRYNFALALQQANYFLDAERELERVVAASPEEVRARLALGNLCAQQLGLPALARVQYLKVLEMDPRNPQAEAIRRWLNANP